MVTYQGEFSNVDCYIYIIIYISNPGISHRGSHEVASPRHEQLTVQVALTDACGYLLTKVRYVEICYHNLVKSEFSGIMTCSQQ